jgi:hypothetical protein
MVAEWSVSVDVKTVLQKTTHAILTHYPPIFTSSEIEHVGIDVSTPYPDRGANLPPACV